MADRKSDGTDPWPRMSAWLPPGLALAWLAVLATLVHNVASVLIAWGATVLVVVLIAIVLALLYRVVSSRSRSKVSGGTTETLRTRAPGCRQPSVATWPSFRA